MAGPDGGVLWVGFVNVGEYFGELGSVVGDFKYVVLCLSYEVGYVAGRGGYVAGLVEPDGGPSTPLDCRSGQASAPLRFAQDRLLFPLICRCLWRAESVVELLLELGDPSGRLEAAAILGAGMSEL